MPIRECVAVVAVVVECLACTNCVVVPAKGGTSAKTMQSGLALNAVPNAWNDRPIDLDHFVTPIWIQIVNSSKRDIRVTYTDLALTNGTGYRFPAISPYPVRMDPSSISDPVAASPIGKYGAQDRARTSPNDPRDAVRDATQWTARGNDAAGFESLGHLDGRHVGRDHGATDYAHHGFYGDYSPWPYYDYGPHYYGPYVQYWGDRQQWVDRSIAVLMRGMPEGVLPAGGKIAGFVYFRHAAAKPAELNLIWTAHDPNGSPVAALRVGLSVVQLGSTRAAASGGEHWKASFNGSSINNPEPARRQTDVVRAASALVAFFFG